MKIKLSLRDIQHIKNMDVELNFADSAIACIVGRNGCGKTTLVRALKNVIDATTFAQTAGPNIFKASSQIDYEVNGENISYTYNTRLNVLDSKQSLKDQKSLLVELPLPHGERFKYFQALGKIDDELRALNTQREFEAADELIELYRQLYNLTEKRHRFTDLKQVWLKGQFYYFIRQKNDFYIRQDYFSSGEYFVLELYRLACLPNRLIVVDELDISLDAAAQVKLLDLLRPILERNNTKLLFTTHSLALMKTLKPKELHFMENQGGKVAIEKRSYAFIKASLFGFSGWDRVILVEDKEAKQFIEWLLKNCGRLLAYNVIYIGGHENVFDLFRRNGHENYFDLPIESVRCCLDGDQSRKPKYQRDSIMFLPVESLEKRIAELHNSGMLPVMLIEHERFKDDASGKKIYEHLTKKPQNGMQLMTIDEVCKHVYDIDRDKIEEFREELLSFLSY